MATQLPGQAQVVIIGGGIVGCSVAYHLTKIGWTDVLLLETGGKDILRRMLRPTGGNFRMGTGKKAVPIKILMENPQINVEIQITDNPGFFWDWHSKCTVFNE